MGRVNMIEYLLNLYPDTRKYQTDMALYETQADAFETWSTKPHWTGPSFPSTQVIPNDTTLIVIIDGNVASSGEGFIHYLFQVENVVVVGENSKGALTFGPVSRHQLPHSKLFVALPINFGIFIDLEFREEKGFFPDLWVPAEDALNYAVAAVRKGTITTLQPLPEEVLQEEFIPEEFLPQGLSRVQFKSEMIFLIPAAILVILGFVLMYVLKKKMLSYFAFGLSWFPFGAVLLSKESFLGYVFIIIGTIFITLNVYEWRKSTPDTSSKE